jgi:hypothetical protein
MTLDGRRFCFTSVATIRRVLEVVLKKIKKDTKRITERKKFFKG